MKNRVHFLVAVFAWLTLVPPCPAENWPSWRGPTSNGVAPPGDYPISWSTEENIVWSIDLPGAAGSTPVVWGNRIFLTGPDQDRNAVICLDRSGREQWRTDLGALRPGKHKKASGCNPSPVIDGRHVWVYFKSGDLGCLNYQGEVLWQVNLQKRYGEDTLWWDLGTSPVLSRDYVIVAVMQTGDSYLVAFEKESGKVAWKVDRNLGAPEEAAQSYSTPVVIDNQGTEQVIVVGADHVTCHDASNGNEIWRVGGLNPTQHKYFRSISSVVVSDGYVLAPYARGDTVTAIRLGGQGDVTDTHVAWTISNAGADVPTPVALDGRFYVVREKAREVVCRDIKSSEIIWRRKLEKHRRGFSSSPVLASGKLYVTREDGTVFVLNAQDGKLLSQNRLDGGFTAATPVFVDNQILLRTGEKLYCIGK